MARLRAAGSIDCFSAADLAGVSTARQVLPAYHVLYQGYDVGQRLGTGERSATEILQRWIIVVAVSTAAFDIDTGDPQRQAAEDYIDEALEALCNWRPIAGGAMMVPEAAPAPYVEPAFIYFPLPFVRRYVVRGVA